MKARKFTVQPFAGGAPVSFYEVPPANLRAPLAFKGDTAFDKLPKPMKDFCVGTAVVILSARARGYADALGLPDAITAEACEEFSTRYLVGVEAEELPETPQEGDGQANPAGGTELPS